MADARFEEIYAEFREPVRRYLARLVSEDESEDLVQETFVKVSKGLHGFRGESKLSTWIYRIATNTALDRLRDPEHKASHTRTAAGETDTGAVTHPLTAKLPAVDKRLEQKQMSECVRGVMDELPPDYKTAIVLGELEEMTGREMAEILGISVGAAKVRLHRARAAMKDLLNEKCDFSRDERNVFVCSPVTTSINFLKKS